MLGAIFNNTQDGVPIEERYLFDDELGKSSDVNLTLRQVHLSLKERASLVVLL